MAFDFSEQFSISFALYTDPKRESYKMMRWKHQLGLGFNSLKNGWSAFSKGHRQGKILGDPRQQGGEAIILQDGTVWWSHPANEAGTHTSSRELRTLINRFSTEKESR
jgi:hypothetical protein